MEREAYSKKHWPDIRADIRVRRGWLVESVLDKIE